MFLLVAAADHARCCLSDIGCRWYDYNAARAIQHCVRQDAGRCCGFAIQKSGGGIKCLDDLPVSPWRPMASSNNSHQR